MYLAAFRRAVALFGRTFPAFVKALKEADEARERSRLAYREGLERVRRLEFQGPHIQTLPTKSVDSIEEYLDHLTPLPYRQSRMTQRKQRFFLSSQPLTRKAKTLNFSD